MKGDRILVTGSSGVVGRALTLALESRGQRVRPFDVRADGGSRVSENDVRSREGVERALEGVEGVVHLAAISRGAPAEEDPALAHSVNVEGTRTMLEALRSAGSRAWFVYASSREVYGEPLALPVDEDHPLRPKGVYGRTKAAAEDVVRDLCSGGRRRAIVLRFTNLYGDPHDYPERVIPAFIDAALHDRSLEVRGPGNLLDFLHLSDAVRATLKAIDWLSTSPLDLPVLNIASGRGITLGDLATMVVSLAGSSSPVRLGPPVSWTPSRFVGDCTRAERRLGWKPSILFDDGLRDLIGQHRSLLRRP